MKAFKLCENAQHKNLSTTECNNNSTNNGKSANSYVKNATESIKNGSILSDKVFKQRISSSTSSTNQTNDERIASSASVAPSSSSKKACNIENFLSSNVPNASATVETARNGFLAAAAAAQQYTPFNLFTPYLKDMFIAAQLLRGNIEDHFLQEYSLNIRIKTGKKMLFLSSVRYSLSYKLKLIFFSWTCIRLKRFVASCDSQLILY